MTIDESKVSLGEVAVVVAAVAVALIAWVSLALAQHGRHSLPAVAAAAAVPLAGLAWMTWRGRASIAFDRRELILLAGVGALATIMFVPGFPYAYGDKDPGIYVSHGFAIAREGSTVIDDPILEAGDQVVFSEYEPGGRFTGITIDSDAPTKVEPQFFHMYPALLATASDVAGRAGVFHVNPLLAILAMLAVTLAVRRVFGTAVSAVTAVLMITNMMQVWQAKFPSTEILTQLLLAAAALAIVSSIGSRSRAMAGVGGLLIGLSFLARPDGLLPILIASGAVAGLIAVRRADVRVVWFLAGLAVALPHALVNAYVTRDDYSRLNDLPRIQLVALLFAALAAVAIVGRLVWPSLRSAWFEFRARADDPEARSTRLRNVAAAAFVVLYAAMLLVFWFREDLWGQSQGVFGNTPIRTFDEQNLLWLSFFLSRRGLILVVIGLAVLLASKLQFRALVLVGPGLLLLPVYLYESRISPRLMWWVRRFIPTIFPVLCILIAIALVAMYRHRRLIVRAFGVVLGVSLVVQFAAMSLPLRSHREYANSLATVERISAVNGDRPAVFLWEYPPPNDLYAATRNFPGPLFMIEGRPSAFLPANAPQSVVDQYAVAFPDHDIFVVTPHSGLVDTLDPTRYEIADQFVYELPFWEESKGRRPDKALTAQANIQIFRLVP